MLQTPLPLPTPRPPSPVAVPVLCMRHRWTSAIGQWIASASGSVHTYVRCFVHGPFPTEEGGGLGTGALGGPSTTGARAGATDADAGMKAEPR